MTNAALKLKGPWEFRRKFKIPTLSDPDDAEHVEQATYVKAFANPTVCRRKALDIFDADVCER